MIRRPSYAIGLAAAAATVLFVSGCSTNNAAPTGPSASSQTQADDAAQTLGIMMGRENGVLLQQSALLPATSAARPGAGGLTMVVPQQPKRRGGGPDETLVAGNITWLLNRVFYDAANVNQGDYDATTTARMSVTGTGRGTAVAAPDTGDYRGFMALQMKGLLPSSPVVTVTGTRRDSLESAFSSHFRDARVRLKTVAAASIDDVVQGKSEVTPWPANGSMTWVMTVRRMQDDGAYGAPYTTTGVVRFDGTPTPGVVFDQRWRYTLDLRTGEMIRLPS